MPYRVTQQNNDEKPVRITFLGYIIGGRPDEPSEFDFHVDLTREQALDLAARLQEPAAGNTP